MNPIYVSKPTLPSLDILIKEITTLYSTRILTNSGPYSIKLEDNLT